MQATATQAATPTWAAMSTPLHIVAVVKSGKEELLVLNRRLDFVYDELPGGHLLGRDGPFERYLAFKRGWGDFVAFGGSGFTVRMIDGTSREVKDHWWHGSRSGFVDVAVQTVAGLRECFIFCGGPSISGESLAELRSAYTGGVFECEDYEKVMKFDRMKVSFEKLLAAEKKRRKALVRAIKRMGVELASLKEEQA